MNISVMRNRTTRMWSRSIAAATKTTVGSQASTNKCCYSTSLIFAKYPIAPKLSAYRYLSTSPDSADSAERDYTHFKISSHKHPLEVKKISSWVDKMTAEAAEEMKAADHTGRQQNHIWSKEELEEAMSTLYRHQPKSFSDHVMNKLVS